MGGDEKEPILHQDLRRGQINPKLRIGFHAGHFSSVTAARFFNLVRPPIIIIETGQSVCTRVYTVYTCILARIYTCYICYSRCLSRPEQEESISLCNFCRATGSSFTHRDWTLHAFTHTQIGALHLTAKRFTTGKLASTCNAMARFTHLQKGIL